jgi:hypothetical protein
MQTSSTGLSLPGQQGKLFYDDARAFAPAPIPQQFSFVTGAMPDLLRLRLGSRVFE